VIIYNTQGVVTGNGMATTLKLHGKKILVSHLVITLLILKQYIIQTVKG